MTKTPPGPTTTLTAAVLLAAMDRQRRVEILAALDHQALEGLAQDLLDSAMEDPLLYASDPADFADRLLDHKEPFRWIVDRKMQHNAVAHRLIERSRRALAADPATAELAARLAHDLLQTAPAGSPVDSDLLTAAAIHVADALLALGEIADALLYVDQHAHLIPLVRSERLRGDLRMSAANIYARCCQPAEALALLDAAIADYVAIDDSPRLVRAALLSASILRSAGALPQAIEFLEPALRLVGPSKTDLYVSVRHNLAAYAIEAGHLDRARQALDELAPLQFRPEFSYRDHHQWLCARLAEAAGDLSGARDLYQELYPRFLAADKPRAAALVLLDLAVLALVLDDRASLSSALVALRGALSLLAGSDARLALEALDGLGFASPTPPFLAKLSRLLAAR